MCRNLPYLSLCIESNILSFCKHLSEWELLNVVGTTKFRTLTLFANCDDFIN